MSAELIDDPNIPQTVEHDLESFYWVLLWICLSYMGTNLSTKKRSSILNSTMSPRAYNGTSGCDKKNFIANSASLLGLEVPASPVIPKLIKSLHQRLGEWYQLELPSSELLSSRSSVTSGTTSSTIQSAEQSKKVVSHEELLQILQEALEDGLWGEGDHAVPQEVLASQDKVSHFSSCLKRSHSIASWTGGFCVPPQAKQSEIR